MTEIAIVESIEAGGAKAKARLADASACDGCAIARICKPSANGGLEFDVPKDADLQEGDVVRLSRARGLTWIAILVVFILPIALVIGSLAVGRMAGQADSIAVAEAFVALVIYFVLAKIIASGQKLSVHKYVEKIEKE